MVALFLFGCVGAWPVTSGLVAARDLIEPVNPHARINWSRAVVIADESHPGSNRPKQRNAKADATQPSPDLFQAVEQVRIDASRLVKDLVKNSDMVRAQLDGMLRNPQIVRREYLSDGTVRARLAFSLTGGLAQLALPQSIKPVPQIKTCAPISDASKPAIGAAAPFAGTTVFTGLILDARGLDGFAALVPVVVTESGDEIYGPAVVSREYAVQRGMAAFVPDLETARTSPRVTNHPMIVRGLRTLKGSGCTFVISDADGAMVRGASESLSFLKQCKVIIVLDPIRSGPG